MWRLLAGIALMIVFFLVVIGLVSSPMPLANL